MTSMTKSYAIVALDNGNISSIPIIWLIQYDEIIFENRNYNLYLPLHEFEKESEGYANVKKDWIKTNGKVLNITGELIVYLYVYVYI